MALRCLLLFAKVIILCKYAELKAGPFVIIDMGVSTYYVAKSLMSSWVLGHKTSRIFRGSSTEIPAKLNLV